jgi:hypothetical protein
MTKKTVCEKCHAAEFYRHKHFILRGTHDLKFPTNADRCMGSCGTPDHDVIVNENGETVGTQEHRCFLRISHAGRCQFSSECSKKAALDTAEAFVRPKAAWAAG